MKKWKGVLNRIRPIQKEEDLMQGEEMDAALMDLSIYRGQAPWLPSCGGRSLHLGRAVCRELARTVCAEIGLDCKGENGEEYGWLKRQLMAYLPHFHQAVGAVCGCGRVMLRLYPKVGGIGVDLVLPDRYRVLSRGADGRITGLCFYEYASEEGASYLRKELHLLDGAQYRIEHQLYQLGAYQPKRVPLGFVKRFADLPEQTVCAGVSEGFFVEWCLDAGEGSARGEAIWGDARGLMEDADRQYERLLWEFEGGELAVDVSEDAFRTDSRGNAILPSGKDRLYRMNLLDGGEDGVSMKVFSPELRDQSLIRGLNRILMGFEDAVGIARGTISDPSSVAKTATEVMSARQRTHLSALQLRRQARDVLETLSKRMAELGWLYGMSEPRGFETVVRFGDGVLGLSEEAREADRADVLAGLMSAETYQARWGKGKEK